jgi:serine phosphatase RsbU (regulator of sigma subunit)
VNLDRCSVAAIVWLLLGASPQAAALSAQPRIETLSPDTIGSQGLQLVNWLYVADSASPGSEPPGREADWVALSPTLRPGETPEDWAGSGWFRLELEVTPELAGRTLALRLHRHHGASRTYLDGAPIAEIGRLAGDSGEVVPALRPEPMLLHFESAGRHRLLVEFVNPDIARYHRVGYFGGFSAWLGPTERAISRVADEQRLYSGRRGLYTGVFLSFALLHLLLWTFRRESRENLYFSLTSTSLALLAFLLSHKGVATDPRIVFWTEPLMHLAGVGFSVFGVLFVHQAFTGAAPRWRRWVAPAIAAIAIWGALRPPAAEGVLFLLMLAALVEMGRAVLMAVRQRRSGAPIVALGILAVIVGFGSGLLANLGVLPRVPLLTFVAPFASVLLLIVSMSVYLARRVARTHRDLEAQLERVRALSEEKLEQERRAGREQTKRRLLEAEFERKNQELEEARQLQLSMLPRQIPEHPQLEIAVHMSTATEVGGDYYDFDLADDGALTFAVGDATGHGMRAGTMVTATKSLFNALGSEDDLVSTVRRKNQALKRMNLRSLNMALLLARYRDGQLLMSAAGMPFPLVARASGELECVEISGMPLGCVRSFPYQSERIDLSPGDAVLFMSDGFPELLNPDDEMLGYESAGDIFTAAAGLSATAIVERLVESGETWRAGRDPDDDMTFVVMKRR